MPQVPTIATPLDPETLRDVMIGGHISAAGEPPNYNRLAVGWAQVMLETGRGQAIWNYDVGNLKCPPECQEDQAWVLIPVPTGSAEMATQRAYPGPVEGCAAYWRLIGASYSQALPYFDAGKPYEAMQALYNGGQYPSYFQAPPDAYGQTVAALFTEFIAKWPRNKFDPGGRPAEPEQSPAMTIAVLGGLGLALGAGLYYWKR
jgi:hypothetical protein